MVDDSKFLADVMDLHDPFHLDAYVHFMKHGFLPKDYVDWSNQQGIKKEDIHGRVWYRVMEDRLIRERLYEIYFEVYGKEL